MSVQKNKATVKQYIQYMNETDPQKLMADLSDDFMFESMLQKPEAFHVTWDKKTFAELTATLSSHMLKPLKITIVSLIAEGHKVAVEAQSYGELKTGKIYENAYHFLFKLREGKIYNIREYSCSYTAYDCLGNLFVADKE